MKKVLKQVVIVLPLFLSVAALVLVVAFRPPSIYSADTEAGPDFQRPDGHYRKILSNESGIPTVTVTKNSSGEVAVDIVVSTVDARRLRADSWTKSTDNAQRAAEDGGKIPLVSPEQNAALQCIFKTQIPQRIRFIDAGKSMMEAYMGTYAYNGEVYPSRYASFRGTVVNYDCSVKKREKATISAVYIIKVNLIE